jgi:uncharacterized membrane protein (DUF485 family)
MLEASMAEHHSHTELLQDPDFQDLMRQKNSISAVLTVVMLVVYLGFVLLLAFAPAVLAVPWSRGVTRGIPLGIGIIVLAWILTGIYVRWANSRYDAMVGRLRAKAEALANSETLKD